MSRAPRQRTLELTRELQHAQIVAGLPEAVEPLDYYHELDPTLFSIGSDTFLGSLYAMLGMASIAERQSASFNFSNIQQVLY